MQCSDGMINGVTDIEDTNSIIFQSHTENQNAGTGLEVRISSPESVNSTCNIQTDVLLAELLSVLQRLPDAK